MGIMSSEWSGRLQHWMRTLKDDFYRPLGTISWEAFRTMESPPCLSTARNLVPIVPPG